jgi:UDP-glucose 4-epimerase
MVTECTVALLQEKKYNNFLEVVIEGKHRMRVIVTGGAGFIGSHLVDALIENGYEVAVVDNLSRGKPDNVNSKAKLYTVDICSQDLKPVFDQVRPNLVFHLAARTSVNHSITDPVDDASVNILGSINLFQNCARTGVTQLIYSSTGGALYGEPQYLPCDEDHPINPLSPYGASKHAAEHYLYIFRTLHHLDYTILRYPNVYGPRQDSLGEAGVIAIFADRMNRGQPVTIYGTGKQERDFLYVQDIVRANLAVISNGGGKIYNLSSGGSISINDLFEKMKKIARYRKDPIYEPARSGEVFKIYLSTDRIEKESGWKPQISLDEGLTATLKYYAANIRPDII